MNEASSPAKKKKKNQPLSVLVLVVIVIIAWILIRPGVFTVQPIGALPEGITFIYHSRSSEMPFFSSPDGLCLEMQGSVTLLCRSIALSEIEELADRIIIRFSYSKWAYLRSTNGQEFE